MSAAQTRGAPAARGTIPWPWLDRQRRVSALKTAALALAFAPGIVLAVQWAEELLGPRALNAAIHGTGLWAVRFLLISLAVTPLRFLLDWPRVMILRRQLGLTALAYALVHLVLFAIDKGGDIGVVATEIVSRVYLAIGFTALLGLAVLGVTSTDGMLRRLGRRWKRLHRMVYAIAVLALLHHFMQAKADVSSAVLVAGLYLWLMLSRAIPKTRQRSIAAYAVVALLATAGTMAIEFAWYAIATRINAWRVLDANFSIAFGPRPSLWVAVLGLAATAVIAARRLRASRPPQPQLRTA
jgi:sulfoxide reductase heme-binding subunit YedZ